MAKCFTHASAKMWRQARLWSKWGIVLCECCRRCFRRTFADSCMCEQNFCILSCSQTWERKNTSTKRRVLGSLSASLNIIHVVLHRCARGIRMYVHFRHRFSLYRIWLGPRSCETKAFCYRAVSGMNCKKPLLKSSACFRGQLTTVSSMMLQIFSSLRTSKKVHQCNV